MEFLIYLLKVNIAIILMYGFYGLLVRNDTFFQWKRILLLSIAVIALLFPLVKISLFPNSGALQDSSGIMILPSYYLNEVIVTTNQAPANNNFSFVDLLTGIYWLGVLVLLIRMLAQIISVCFLLHQAQKTQINGQQVYRKEGLQMPFSFFRYIVLDTQKYTINELQEIIRHEETHVRQWHSLDVVMAELLTVFCWFNPFIWMIKREIRMNLEFISDHSVIDLGLGREHYQFHLLRLTYHKAAAKITNNFNVSPLKKRIFMMNKKETPRLGLAKYLFILPIIAALLIFNKYDINAKNFIDPKSEPVAASTEALSETPVATETGAPSTEMPQQKAPQQKTTPAAATDKKIYDHVEQVPYFPGGEAAMMKWIQENVKYPTTAQEKGIQGPVIVKFIIRSDGSVDNAKVVKSLSPECDAEALRAIKTMPKFIPGKQNGSPVDVYFILPIYFNMTYTEVAEKAAKQNPAIKSTQTVSTVVQIDGKVVSEEEWKNADPTKLELVIFSKQLNPTRMIMIFKTKK